MTVLLMVIVTAYKKNNDVTGVTKNDHTSLGVFSDDEHIACDVFLSEAVTKFAVVKMVTRTSSIEQLPSV